jgi:hypothetical protein
LEPEVARAFSARLGEVLESLAQTETLFSPLAISMPSQDLVSSNASRQALRMINDARAYVEAWRGQLSAARLALESQLAAYEDVERQNEAQV